VGANRSSPQTPEHNRPLLECSVGMRMYWFDSWSITDTFFFLTELLHWHSGLHPSVACEFG
jgi:hypothetical protein